MKRRGFTLVELLVVAAIVAVLVGLLLPLVGMIKRRARDTATAVRIEAVLQELSRVGREQGMLSHGLMIAAGLPGVKLMTVDRELRPVPETDPQVLAQDGIEDNDWMAYDRDHQFAFPWGRESDSDDDGDWDDPPLRRSIGDLSPERSHALLQVAGVLPADDPSTAEDESLVAYRDRRGPDLPWNDAWGSPIVVAYGLYQADGRDPALGRVMRALQHYQYNRSLFLCAGSAGPVSPAGTGLDWVDTIAIHWDEIDEACNRDQLGDPLWDQDAFADPPWQGVRVVGDGVRRHYLSAPVELK